MRSPLPLLFTLLAASGAAFAQSDFPTKPVTVSIPNPGGSTMDTEVRIFTQSIMEATGKTFLLDYKPGAATTISTGYVAKARPDGYTMLATNASFAIASAAFTDLPYDNIRDFTPITLLDKHPYLLLVNAASPFKSVSDYVAYARANPEKLNYSTSGAGSVTHLSGALLHTMSNTKVTYIHFKSAAQRILDVVAGRIDASMTAPITAVPLMNAGKLRAIGITTDHRIPLLPDLPTIAEQGVPGFEFTSWIGTFAPAGVPAPVLNRLNQIWVATTKDPKVIKKLEADGTIAVAGPPEQFRQFIAVETERWRKLFADTGLKLEPE